MFENTLVLLRGGHTEKARRFTRRFSDRKNVNYKNGFRGVHIENASVLKIWRFDL